MVLSLTTATTQMLRLFDASRADHYPFGAKLTADGTAVDFPASYLITAKNWAKAASGYFQELSAPPIIPAGLLVAEDALVAAMAPALGPTPTQAIQALQAGFQAYVAALMPFVVLPAVATPPPAPPPFVFGAPTSDPRAPAIAFATIIDTWARTGLQGVPPAGPVAPWV